MVYVQVVIQWILGFEVEWRGDACLNYFEFVR